MHPKQSSPAFLSPDFLNSWIYMFSVFADIAHLFTKPTCINQFINQFRNPLTSARAEEVHRESHVSRIMTSWERWNEDFKENIFYLHPADCNTLVLWCYMCSFSFNSIKRKKSVKRSWAGQDSHDVGQRMKQKTDAIVWEISLEDPFCRSPLCVCVHSGLHGTTIQWKYLWAVVDQLVFWEFLSCICRAPWCRRWLCNLFLLLVLWILFFIMKVLWL